jgi:hypothetical protein
VIVPRHGQVFTFKAYSLNQFEKGIKSRIRLFNLVLLALLATGSPQALRAQDLAPRAYVITPLHSNAVVLTWSYYDGTINFNGALPVSNATGKYSVPTFSY